MLLDLPPDLIRKVTCNKFLRLLLRLVCRRLRQMIVPPHPKKAALRRRCFLEGIFEHGSTAQLDWLRRMSFFERTSRPHEDMLDQVLPMVIRRESTEMIDWWYKNIVGNQKRLEAGLNFLYYIVVNVLVHAATKRQRVVVLEWTAQQESFMFFELMKLEGCSLVDRWRRRVHELALWLNARPILVEQYPRVMIWAQKHVRQFNEQERTLDFDARYAFQNLWGFGMDILALRSLRSLPVLTYAIFPHVHPIHAATFFVEALRNWMEDDPDQESEWMVFLRVLYNMLPKKTCLDSVPFVGLLDNQRVRGIALIESFKESPVQ